MAPGQKDRSLYNKHGKITQSHYRCGYKHQEPASGRPLYSSSDYELSLLRDWQLGSYGSDGIGRQRTLGPSYMGTSDWKKSTVTNKPPPDFSEIPHRPRGTNKPLHGVRPSPDDPAQLFAFISHALPDRASKSKRDRIDTIVTRRGPDFPQEHFPET